MQITLEGHDRPVPVEAGDTILASLLRAGVPFPFSCQAGNCGTCKCELVSGDVLELEYSEHALVRAGTRARPDPRLPHAGLGRHRGTPHRRRGARDAPVARHALPGTRDRGADPRYPRRAACRGSRRADDLLGRPVRRGRIRAGPVAALLDGEYAGRGGARFPRAAHAGRAQQRLRRQSTSRRRQGQGVGAARRVVPARAPPRPRASHRGRQRARPDPVDPVHPSRARSRRAGARCTSACAASAIVYHEPLLKDLAARHAHFTYQRGALGADRRARAALRPGARGYRSAVAARSAWLTSRGRR